MTAGIEPLIPAFVARQRWFGGTDVGAVRELVEDGVTGLVVGPEDPRAIAAATLRLLGDRELRDAMGAAGRRRAAERFGLERLADLHLRAYELARAHRRGRLDQP